MRANLEQKRDLENFWWKLPIIKFSSGNDHHKSCIVNRQIGVGDSKYVVIVDPLQPGHVTVRAQCAILPFTQGNAGLVYIGPLQPNISVTEAFKKKVSTTDIETTYSGKNDHVTDDVTWPRKVKTVTQICLRINISQIAQDSGLVSMEHHRKPHGAHRMIT